MFLKDFDKREIEAIARLVSDPDFKIFVEYIKVGVAKLSLDSVNTSGDVSERFKGGCKTLQELRDNIVSARDVLERLKNSEIEFLERDPISP